MLKCLLIVDGKTQAGYLAEGPAKDEVLFFRKNRLGGLERQKLSCPENSRKGRVWRALDSRGRGAVVKTEALR